MDTFVQTKPFSRRHAHHLPSPPAGLRDNRWRVNTPTTCIRFQYKLTSIPAPCFVLRCISYMLLDTTTTYLPLVTRPSTHRASETLPYHTTPQPADYRRQCRNSVIHCDFVTAVMPQLRRRQVAAVNTSYSRPCSRPSRRFGSKPARMFKTQNPSYPSRTIYGGRTRGRQDRGQYDCWYTVTESTTRIADRAR